MSSSASESSTDRAQVFGGPWLAGGVIVGVIVLAIVVNEARSQVAAVDGPVEYCGLCHVDWSIALTVIVAGLLMSVLTWAGLKYMSRGV